MGFPSRPATFTLSPGVSAFLLAAEILQWGNNCPEALGMQKCSTHLAERSRV